MNLWELLTIDSLIAFVTLAALEIVLGIDNIVLIAILCARLEPNAQTKARRLGLLLAMGMRIAMLLLLGWIMGLTQPLFSVWGREFSGRDLILLIGGLFLVAKATYEIHHKLEGPDAVAGAMRTRGSFKTVVAQIIALDIIFSLDSVITAIGMAKHLAIMIAAVVAAVGVMLAFAGRVSGYIERHPTIKMLALSFMLLIGVVLVADGLGHHIQKGYIYFAMAFSLGVELLNIRMRTVTARAAAGS